MTSSNALSTFILHYYINGLCDKNLRSIQDFMRTRKPASTKFIHVCKDSPNTAILTKSITSGDVQLTFTHASLVNRSLQESVTAFVLTGSLEALKVVFINFGIAFSISSNKIWIPVIELLCAAIGNLDG